MGRVGKVGLELSEVSESTIVGAEESESPAENDHLVVSSMLG